MPEIRVAAADELADGDRRLFTHGRHEISVFRWEGAFYAYRNLCPHQGGPACEGLMMPRVEDVFGPDMGWEGQRFSSEHMNFACPWHGYEFDLKTGRCIGDPKLKVRSYPTVERDGGIYVVVE
jgi:nitrite reductase/ring-hydroxylating ferredoxin subunit